MAGPDDWKGEHLIRSVRSTSEAKKAEGARVGVAMNKRKRAKTGAPCAANEKYQRWHKFIFPRRGAKGSDK